MRAAPSRLRRAPTRDWVKTLTSLVTALGLVLLAVAATPASVESGAAPAESAREAPVADAPPDPEALAAGKRLYSIYCTNCHGPEGRGDGAAAASLNPPPADLTSLSRDNDGRFPTARVILAIDGRSRVPGHSSGQMPIWGLSLQEPTSDANQEAQVRSKILQIVEYLKSLQPAEP